MTLNSFHSMCVFWVAHYVIKLIVLLVRICLKNTLGPFNVSFICFAGRKIDRSFNNFCRQTLVTVQKGRFVKEANTSVLEAVVAIYLALVFSA